jgi:hypothetical protein
MQIGESKPSSGQTVPWVIALIFAIVATALWMRPAGIGPGMALAQSSGLAGARGVYAFTGPLARDQYGLFMLDIDAGTVWCYAFDKVDGTQKLRLIAARTWIYDRYLQDFNSAAPDFREIRALVAQQRAADAADVPDAAGSPDVEQDPADD